MDELHEQLTAAVRPLIAAILGEDGNDFQVDSWSDLLAAACESVVIDAEPERPALKPGFATITFDSSEPMFAPPVDPFTGLNINEA